MSSQYLPGEILDLASCAIFADELVRTRETIKTYTEGVLCLRGLCRRELSTFRGRSAARNVLCLHFHDSAPHRYERDACSALAQAWRARALDSSHERDMCNAKAQALGDRAESCLH